MNFRKYLNPLWTEVAFSVSVAFGCHACWLPVIFGEPGGQGIGPGLLHMKEVLQPPDLPPRLFVLQPLATLCCFCGFLFVCFCDAGDLSWALLHARQRPHN